MSATETKMRLMGKAFWGEVSAGTQQVWSTASGKWPSEWQGPKLRQSFLSFFFLIRLDLFILCMWVHCSCLQTHQKRASDPITDSCEPPRGCWELNSGPLGEQSMLLTAEPSLQSPWIVLSVSSWNSYLLWLPTVVILKIFITVFLYLSFPKNLAFLCTLYFK